MYVFTREGDAWTEAGKLEGNSFGFNLPWVDVSAKGSVIVIGANDDPELGQGVGAAYIYLRNKDQGTWMLQQKIFASDPDGDDNFGRDPSLSENGDTILLGANGDDEAAKSAGAAYVFQRKADKWFEQVKLIADDAQIQDHFGAHTKITPNGQRAIIKSANNAPYIFDLIDNQWVNTNRLTSTDTNVVGLGKAIAIKDDGSTVLLGAPNAKVNGVFWYGAVAFFDLEAPLGDLNCDGAITTSDLLELLFNWGSCFYWDPDDGCEFHGGCPGDLDLDCWVGTSDLLILLSNWG